MTKRKEYTAEFKIEAIRLGSVNKIFLREKSREEVGEKRKKR